MSTTLVPLEEYLHTDYSPDREYVDGVIVERNVGKRPHSKVQANFTRFVANRYPAFHVWPEQRVRTSSRRVRIPDVCLTLEDPGTDVFEEAPFLCIEILSPDDAIGNLIKKLDEYLDMGVPHIWVADPIRKKAFTYSRGHLEEVQGPELQAGNIVIPLTEAFDRL